MGKTGSVNCRASFVSDRQANQHATTMHKRLGISHCVQMGFDGGEKSVEKLKRSVGGDLRRFVGDRSVSETRQHALLMLVDIDTVGRFCHWRTISSLMS